VAFNDFLVLPQSKKITQVEIDTPLTVTWINKQPGIWESTLITSNTVTGSDGLIGYYYGRNNTYFNIESFFVDGELYNEVASLVLCISTNKSWFYDTSTTKIYVHLDSWKKPIEFFIVSPGAVIGFTNQIDNTTKNYFENVYYEPLLESIPNLTKRKDSLFFGILQYPSGTVSLDNTPDPRTGDGYFDNFAQRDLYGQPIRTRLSFEGLAYANSQLVYSGRVEDFANDFTSFKLIIADIRKLFSRQLPVNTFTASAYPNMDPDLLGTPIPIAFGPIIKAPAYQTDVTDFTFADTEFNSIVASIVVYDEDDNVITHGGTETNGTFTLSITVWNSGTAYSIGDYVENDGSYYESIKAGTNFEPPNSEYWKRFNTDKITVSFSQTTVQNGLDIISDVLENYENVTFNAANYDLTEWNAEKSNVSNEGIWIGKNNLLTAVDIIEQVCTDNQGIFDVLASGKFTFRTYDPDRATAAEIYEDELIDDPSRVYDSEEFLSSVKVAYSKNLKTDNPVLFTNTDFESEVFGRYRQYKERTFETALTTETDAETLTDRIMEQSKFIYPIITLKTKIQHINLRILDNVIYTYKRQNGNVIIPRSTWQILGLNINLSTYEMGITIKQISEI
jgi:hypothetical protein